MGLRVKAAGFEPLAYRGQSAEFRAAITDDRRALLHLLDYCSLTHFSYPIRLDTAGFSRLAEARCWNRNSLAELMSSLINSHLLLHPDTARDADFWQAVLPAMQRVGQPYLLIGDSHSLASRIVGNNWRDPIIPIHLACLGGSALGLNNPHSRSGYHSRLARLAAALGETGLASRLPVFFQFGQVDVEFVSVFRRIQSGERAFDRAGFEAFCDTVSDAYHAFLGSYYGSPFATHVLSIFPPALSDESWAQGYANAHIVGLEGDRSPEAMIDAVRSIDIPKLSERTAMHDSFNQRLRAICNDRGFRFIDLFTPILGSDGTIDQRFVARSAGRDHHVDPEPLRSVVGPILKASISRNVRLQSDR
ncbi:hypothetical protein HCU64_13230 [Methylobacterium sp. C25]|uniref:hypothetical protein n=1 Tax=Methylobacterium sp. C25 TaxID=2721622 RepID=UPI001F355D2B|nr:hypothetical protein [Methylobacterium sp. C25]MCE4224721.1 hypothetical protein [Methylobacterium sp. C25]